MNGLTLEQYESAMWYSLRVMSDTDLTVDHWHLVFEYQGKYYPASDSWTVDSSGEMSFTYSAKVPDIDFSSRGYSYTFGYIENGKYTQITTFKG